MTVNNVSGITPAIWSTMVQIPLYKTLVSLEVASVHDASGKDTIHTPRFSDVSAQTYSPVTAGSISATNVTWSYDTVVITTYKHATVYIDEAQSVVTNVSQWRDLASDEAYRIKDKIDTHVFANITGQDGFYFQGVDAQTLLGGTANRAISATSGNMITLFANARKLLRKNNVEEYGDWCAVVTPTIAANIEIKAATSGFNVADAALRNGFAGKWMGFEVYISNNLPSGKCTAMSPGTSSTQASATTCRSIYFGRKKMIDLYLKAPQLRITPRPDSIGSNYTTWTVYGSGINTKNRLRGIQVACDITSFAE